MSDEGYSFHLVDKKSFKDDDLVASWYNNFRGKRRYIALIEEYIEHIFIVRFYPNSHKNSPHKYNVLINDNDASKVIRTAIDIMLHLFNNYSDASFGFIAANSITEAYEEGKHYTKRFRIYGQLMADFFSADLFSHVSNEENSAYLLVNNATVILMSLRITPLKCLSVITLTWKPKHNIPYFSTRCNQTFPSSYPYTMKKNRCRNW